MTAPNSYAKEVANTIRKQIGVAGFMTLGTSDLCYTVADGKPGLMFHARVLPFLKSGERGARVRIVGVTVLLNALDTYDVTVKYFTGGEWVIHYQQEGVYADQLTKLMLALDYDGPEVLNPRYL